MKTLFHHPHRYAILPAALLLTGMLTACHDDFVDDADSSDTRVVYANYRSSLSRSYGVGFGYDATGEYASYNSVRDCVIDYEKLQSVDANIYTDNFSPRVEMVVDEGFDSNALSTNLSLSAGLSAKLGSFFQGEVNVQYTNEELKTDKYSFCAIRNNYIKVSRHMDPLQLRSLAEEGHTEILTAGFRSRIERISQLLSSPDGGTKAEMSIDTLLQHYGTHFIYQASLGGSLVFNSVFSKSSLAEASKLSIEAKAKFAKLCNLEYKDSSGESYGQRQEMTRYSLQAIGGDGTCCSKILQSSGEEVDKAVLEQWYQSLNFDATNEEKNNLELVDFRLAPIYELIPDEKVRNRVAERFGIYRESAEAALPRPTSALFASIAVQDLGLNTYANTFARLTTEGKVIAEVVTELIPVQGELQYVSTFYPVIAGRVAEEGFSLLLDDDNSLVDSVYVTSWMSTSVVNVSALMPRSEFQTLYYNNGQLGLMEVSGHEYQTLTTDNVELENHVYCWDGYYGDQDMYKVGRYYIMPGPKLQGRNEDNLDLPNDYLKVLADPPYGWEFASSSCGIFRECLPYFEDMVNNTDLGSVWRENMLLPAQTTGANGQVNYNFSIYSPDEEGLLTHDSELLQDLLSEGETSVMMVRSIPYTYR